MNAIQTINSLLDLDLYKLTMLQVVWKKFPDAWVEYTYKCRNDINLTPFIPQIREQIKALCNLRFSEKELTYLKNIRYMDPAFIWFLRYFQLEESCIKIKADPFELTIIGPWIYTILFEVFLLAIISEVYYRTTYSKEEIKEIYKQGDELLTKKIQLVKTFNEHPFRLSEFGTRRRFSSEWQDHVLTQLIQEIKPQLFGTSNVLLAKKHDIIPIGTMAHEYLQAFQALGPQLADSQKAALETWAQVYRGDLGIALTDVISMDAFLKDFDRYYCKLFDGLRHDSGDPYIWARKAIAHYEKFDIDPRTKALVFSDGLTIPKAIKLCQEFEPYIKTSFGVGTNLTCDFPGVPPVNHVIKMTMCNGKPVAKLSDSPGKSMCNDQDYLTYLKRVFDYNIQ